MIIRTLEKDVSFQSSIKEIINFKKSRHIIREATKKDGIRKLNKWQRERFSRIFKENAPVYSFCDFIPASGSGTRMYKELIAFALEFLPEKESFSFYVNRTKAYNLVDFFKELKNFALTKYYCQAIDRILISDLSLDKKRLAIAQELFLIQKLHELPKGVQPFHAKQNKIYTAAEQQYELHKFLKPHFLQTKLHFTVNKKFLSKFEQIINSDDKDQNVSFSIQDNQKKVICLNKYNQIHINTEGAYHKQPAGHGTLLSNLNNLYEDITYIHNIDNVPKAEVHPKIIQQRKIIMGYLFYVKNRVDTYLNLLEQGKLNNRKLKQLKSFLKRYFHLSYKELFENSELGFNSTIYNLLNRPIRVCGMIVTNKEAGGAPYWSKSKQGFHSLQIIEKTELTAYQKSQVNDSYFNPVEIACSLRDYKGKKFDLSDFKNEDAKIFVEKSIEGNQVKFLEEPGLWNGAMDDWLTMFIEVPKEIFNPVKSVVDLLKPNHCE